jgi:hypothetical protein
MVSSIDEFVAKVREQGIDAAYDIFEDGTLEEVRGEIYNLADSGSPEPFRSAMINLGFIDY